MQIFLINRTNGQSIYYMQSEKEAKEWFRSLHSGKMSFNKAKDQMRTARARFTPGAMLTYSYSPKYAQKLPIWDKYPLIVFLEKTKNGWYGINLHYVPADTRAAIIDGLNKKSNNLQRIAQALLKHPATQNSVKRYLLSHTTSVPVLIPRDQWSIAVQLPYQQFIKK